MYMHMNPARKRLVSKPGQWRWSSYNNCSLDENAVTACPITIDKIVLAETYRA